MAKPRKRSRGSSTQGAARRRIAVNARNGSDLCLQCGACCDGTLFDRARLGDDQFDLAASLGLETVRDPEGSGGFALPCPRFVDGCCSIYDQPKPRICGAYQCGLLRAYLAGDENLEHGVATVNLVRSLAHDLEHAMGIAPGTFTMGALTAHLAAVTPWNNPEEHERLLMATLRFDALGMKYFGYQRPSEVVAASGAAVTIQGDLGTDRGRRLPVR